MEPVVLKPPGVVRQAAIYITGAVAVMVVIAIAPLVPLPGAAWYLLLTPVAIGLLLVASRLLTLKVRLDERGIWEVRALRANRLTPWSQVRAIRRYSERGVGGLVFIGVEMMVANRATRRIHALQVQSTIPDAEQLVAGWLDTIRRAKTSGG